MQLLLIFGLLQCFFLGFVRTSPAFEQDAADLSSEESSSAPTYSPYKTNFRKSATGSYLCPNRHVFSKTALDFSIQILCPQINDLAGQDYGLIPLSSSSNVNRWEFPIHSNGKLCGPVKCPISNYLISVRQELGELNTCYLENVFMKMGNSMKLCLYSQRSLPNRASDLKADGGISLSCNGKEFRPEFVKSTWREAKKAQLNKLTRLELMKKPDQGFPIRFEQNLFSSKETWLFPLGSDGKSIYKTGEPIGPYYIVIKESGSFVGAIYKKKLVHPMRGLSKESRPGMRNEREFGVCRIKPEI